MHLEQLQAILEVASTGSISAAARNLETNQPSLSRTIKTLEKELNVNFFERTSNGVQLTEAGERLLPYISQIIQDVYQLSKEAFRITTDTCPELSAEPAVVRHFYCSYHFGCFVRYCFNRDCSNITSDPGKYQFNCNQNPN